MALVIGKRYFGPHDAARIVTAVDGNEVTWMSPATLSTDSGKVSDFKAWALKSDRRNYTGSDGERRIKLSTTEPVIEEGEEVRSAGVSWVPVDAPFDLQWSDADAWAEWRADAQ